VNNKQQQKQRHMKKLTTLLLAVLFTGKLLLAQTVDDARKSLYYGRTTSAKQALEKLVQANSKNAEAIYWLGQTHLANEDIPAARQAYQNALTAGVNDPLVWVGMGHVELLDGKKDAARQRFEAAITNSITKKKENPAILNAIGRANADGPANTGDPAYAIEKLKKAIELDPNNADAYTNLGINYLKLGPDQGGNAYEAFTNALRVDPKFARANFRLGKIFQSQGNAEKFIDYYNKAVTADPSFAPAYLELYDYYSLRDVNAARGFLESYIANSDKDCNTEYFYADYLFRSGKYQESLDKAKAMASGACSNYPRLKVLYAYNYDRLGDSVQARSNIESYLNSLDPAKVTDKTTLGQTYLFGASVLKKFPGGEEVAINYLKKALEFDTARATRFTYMDTIASLYRRKGDMQERLNWLQQSFQTNPNPTNLDIYNLADAAIDTRNFALADSMSQMYVKKYPTQEYGYVLLTRAAKAGDADSSKGTAFDEVQQYIDFLKQDPAKNASKIKYQYYYIASAAADKMKDYPKALTAVNSILEVDPEDTFAKQAKPVLEKVVNGKSAGGGTTTPARKPATPAKKGR
jgi:tetratricopeptide (TPR) repeat protein